jgi:hypothetical protein
MLAVCDHNSAGNVGAVWEAARRAGGATAETAGTPAPREIEVSAPVVIPGIEITSREEVHVLGLFADPAAAAAVGHAVLSTLPEGHRGDAPEQPLFDAEDRRIGSERRPLAAASSLSLSAAVALIRDHGGLAVAAHVDRRAFSVIGQLGFLPEEPRFDAAELSAAGWERGRAAEYGRLGLPLICGSDGHFLEDVGRGRTLLWAVEPSFAELALAMQGCSGRRCDLG